LLLLGLDILIFQPSSGPHISELRKNKIILLGSHAVRRLTPSITDD